MFIHEMNEFQCRKALEQASVGRLACAKDNQPYVVPIYFSFDGRHLYGFTTLGQKTEWMRTNPKVCLEIDERRSHDRWTSVIVFGRYEELPDDPEFGAARVAAHEALQKRAMWWEPAYLGTNHFDVRHSLSPIFYRIHIERITGRRATPDKEEAVESSKDKHTWFDKILHRLRLIEKGSPIQ
jgi:nitroimidazol reductase NimA-like FMN-containing flavoprotein (pyridoxamine 5'-phosphate oxidase superfamily)